MSMPEESSSPSPRTTLDIIASEALRHKAAASEMKMKARLFAQLLADTIDHHMLDAECRGCARVKKEANQFLTETTPPQENPNAH